MKDIKDMDLAELVAEIARTGLMKCDEATVCVYQDIIGHTSVGELQKIANGDHKESFYRLYGISYGTVDAIRFYLKNSQSLSAQIEDQYNEGFLEGVKSTEKNTKSLTEELKAESERVRILSKEVERIEELEKEIIFLKAKLYDLITK